MSEQRGNGRADASRRQRRMSGPFWLVVLLGLCLVGGAVLAGTAELVLGWSLPFFVMASSAIGVGTWLPLALSTRSLPNESRTG